MRLFLSWCSPQFLTRCMVVAAVVFTESSLAAEQCSITSAENRVALVELYTSEGCSSCPPADQWLSAFAEKNAENESIIPLSWV